MEGHYRRLVWAVLAVTVVVVGWVGRSSLRGGPESTVIAATPRVLDVPLDRPALPAGPSGSAASAAALGGAANQEGGADALSSGAAKSEGGAKTTLRVHVVGAVRRTGVYDLPAGARVTDAVAKAGGARPDADLEAINLADFARDGEQIHVPSRRATRAVSRIAAPPAPAARAPAARRAPAASAPTRSLGRYPAAAAPAPRADAPARAGDGIVNVNTAGLEELDTLPGVGPATAQAIIDYRREHGPFQRPEDLLNVRNIGEKKLGQMLPRVRVQ
jgi:competence protein ComEA